MQAEAEAQVVALVVVSQLFPNVSHSEFLLKENSSLTWVLQALVLVRSALEGEAAASVVALVVDLDGGTSSRWTRLETRLRLRLRLILRR